MTDLVDPSHIEEIVGVIRSPTLHFGRAVSSEGIFYILHSQQCRDTRTDLRECPWSKALDLGIDFPVEDETLLLSVKEDGTLGFYPSGD